MRSPNLLPAPRSPALRRTALLVLLTFGPVACFWKPVPITRIDSGDEKVEGVRIRVHRPGGEWQEIDVARLDFPYVEGTDVEYATANGPVSTIPGEGAADVEVRTAGAPVRVDLRQMEEIEVYTPTRGVISTLFGAVGAAAVVMLIAVVIVALTKQSCPFVYVVGPDGPVLVGESYSGATSPAVQRDDLMPLPVLPPGPVRLLLTNEALEQQLTDRLELVGVVPRPGTHALATADARVVLASGGAAPVRASDLAGGDVGALVTAADRRAWQTDLEAAIAAASPPARSGIEVAFAPPPAGLPVLELDLVNTAFLDVVTGRLFAAMAGGGDAIRARETAPGWAEEVWRWREREGVDLAVDLWRDGRWARLGVVPTVGAAGIRRVAVPLPASPPGDEVKVRLTGGAGFWAIDRVALSTLVEPSPPLVHLTPSEARDAAGADVRPLLALVDGRHQVLRRTGERVELTFQLPPAEGGAGHAWFLLATGHYVVDRPARPMPSLRTVQALWEEPGAFRRFALDLYREYRRLALSAPVTVKAPP